MSWPLRISGFLELLTLAWSCSPQGHPATTLYWGGSRTESRSCSRVTPEIIAQRIACLYVAAVLAEFTATADVWQPLLL